MPASAPAPGPGKTMPELAMAAPVSPLSPYPHPRPVIPVHPLRPVCRPRSPAPPSVFAGTLGERVLNESVAAKLAWLIRAMRLIWCTIDPLIHHEAQIHHAKSKIIELVSE